MVRRLLAEGHEVTATDIKNPYLWKQVHDGVVQVSADLKDPAKCWDVCRGQEVVYNLAASMGGMGYIENNRLMCMRNVLINTNLIEAAAERGVQRYFFASTACVYAQDVQILGGHGLSEEHAYPAFPEDGYGWEKLFSERLCEQYQHETDMETRVARIHAAYGPNGTWDGGREKVVAALCRKVAQRHDPIEVWGNGQQERSFTFIDDVVQGILMITASDCWEPLNLGSSHRITIDQLLTLIQEIAGYIAPRTYNTTAPRGVAGRSSDNTNIYEILGWEPTTELSKGLVPTYEFIREQVLDAKRS